MKLPLGLIALWLAMALGQQETECTRELARTDDCADVINPNACYNQFRFRDAQTLTCIDGKDTADRARKAHCPPIPYYLACKCCTCVGAALCSFLNQNRYCSAATISTARSSTAAPTPTPFGKGKTRPRRHASSGEF
ncbi:hypothetical protein B0T25DRAFT_497152 [Lasiosphaeria hispida]|uniref:Secreted protein n=1 Tax=Lasiosphaeria hispida TaxID=260671 RepID=A0AAJ0HKJ3_9PEZI|nr:hypothetical protein B0T25DRAFT_497152 [Lasiosphaeria hispida]